MTRPDACPECERSYGPHYRGRCDHDTRTPHHEPRKDQTPMTIRFFTNDKNSLAGKLADAELHFDDGPLAGLKLVGFAVWERRGGGGRNVTFPARAYTINGERRSFALLRPATGDLAAHEYIRTFILTAYDAFEADTAVSQ